jgi:hypothetical protein
VIWRRRRRAGVPAGAVAGSSGQRAPYEPAWQMDQRSRARVAWSAHADAGQLGGRTNVLSATAPRLPNGGLVSQMPTVICTACGAANPDNARFCLQCGRPIGRASGRAPERGTAGETTSMIFTGSDTAEVESPEDPAADGIALDALPPGTALLVVKRGPNTGSRFLLDSDLTVVGRRPDSDIFLDDVTVSRRHAEFYRSGSRFLVRDVGSLNGTYVNRDRIEEVALNGGDEVQIGKFRLVFLQGHR